MGQRLSRSKKRATDNANEYGDLSYEASQYIDPETFLHMSSKSQGMLQRRPHNSSSTSTGFTSADDVTSNNTNGNNNNSPDRRSNKRVSRSEGHLSGAPVLSPQSPQSQKQQKRVMIVDDDDESEESILEETKGHKKLALIRALFPKLHSSRKTNYGGGGYLYF